MEPYGYFLVKIKKSVNVYLWAYDIEELEEYLDEDSDYRIVPGYKDSENTYVEINSKFIKIN